MKNHYKPLDVRFPKLVMLISLLITADFFADCLLFGFNSNKIMVVFFGILYLFLGIHLLNFEYRRFYRQERRLNSYGKIESKCSDCKVIGEPTVAGCFACAWSGGIKL